MEVKAQLIPKLKALRLSGVLATLDVRNRQAIDDKLSYGAGEHVDQMFPAGRSRLRQGLALEALRQDALEGGVAGVVEAQGPPARRLQPLGAILVGETEDGLDGAEPVQRTLLQEPAHHRGRGLSDLRRLLPAVPGVAIKNATFSGG